MADRVEPAAETVALDPRRIRSFLGLILGRLGPRAYGAVSGIFLALLVAEHTSSLLATTFALTAHRFVTWLAYPIAGRMSDRSDTSLGRRVPFMAGGLLCAGGVTALFMQAPSYWSLVGLLVVARLAFTAYNVPATAVTPEAFGSSRWLRAGVAVTIGGILVGLSIRLTVLATWNQSKPSTWGAAYYLSAGYIVFAGLAIAVLVREAPTTRPLIKQRNSPDLLATARTTLAAHNGAPILIALILAVASGGAFDRAYPIYAVNVLGAGGDTLAGAGIASVVLSICTFPIAWWISHRITRRQTALWAGIAAAGTAIAHLWVTELWQSVVLLVVGQIFLIATFLALAPMGLRILPREGGLGERIGVVFAPFLLAGMLASFTTALLYDWLIQDYRVIWVPTAIFALAGGLVPFFLLRGPEVDEVAHPGRMFKTLRTLLWGRRGQDRSLFRGELDEHEVDGTKLLELVADELNPYTQRD